MSQLNELAEDLWVAKQQGTAVSEDSRLELDAAQATHVLKTLAQMAVGHGDEIVGWKIGGSDQTLPFAAPVFKSSGRDLRISSLCSPRFELEFVGRIRSVARGVEFDPDGWTLGLEIVDIHWAWGSSPAWLMADWGMHAGAVLGAPCVPPATLQPTTAQVATPDGVEEVPVNLAVDIGRVTRLLTRYCTLVGRECMAGDLVFTGSVFGSRPVPTPGDYTATIERFGSVSTTLAA